MGIIRLLLALAVVNAHSGYTLFSSGLITGRQSVAIFYVISGFYMAFILNTKYSRSVNFYLSRWLRLYPAYVAGLLLAGAVAVLNEHWGYFAHALATLPSGEAAFVVAANVAIFGQDVFWLVSFSPDKGMAFCPYESCAAHNGFSFLLIPPAFSIAIELLFYLVAPFVLRSWRRSLAYFTAGVAYHVVVQYVWHTNAIAFTYHLFTASIIFFGAGALGFHLYDAKLATRVRVLLFGALVAGCVAAKLIIPGVLFLLVAVGVPAVFRLCRNSGLDRALGNLSYPIYLFHFSLIDLLMYLKVPAAHLGWLAIALSAMLAAAFTYTTEVWVDRRRQRLADRNPEPAYRSA